MRKRVAIPRGVWALGFVSLFMDLSSEVYHGLLPVFLVSTLGASTVALGWIEGVAEATASVTRAFSGALSDAIGRRKPLLLAGYGLAALAKPLFPLADAVGWVFGARFLDRVGKGIRGAPRDALVADLSPPEARGAAFGLRQTLDTVGALLAPLLAIGLLAATGDDVRTVFFLAVIPAVVSVLVLALFVRDPEGPPGRGAGKGPLRLAEMGRLGRRTWGVVLFGGWTALARSSEAFLVLRASDVGLTTALVPLVIGVLSATYAFSAWPVGVLADRVSRRSLVATGLGLLVLSHLALAVAQGVAVALAGAALWGLHLGFTQPPLSALVAAAAPEGLRGTAFGAFHLATGLALLLASLAAGALWDALGASAPFVAGAGVAAGALGALLVARTPARAA